MRHGMTDWNWQGRVQGSLDHSRLNRMGMRQARDVGRYFRHLPIDNVFCSPLHRARHTFDILAAASANPSLINRKPQILDALCEIQLPWQGFLRREISRGRFAPVYSQYRSDPLNFWHHGRNPLADLVTSSGIVWDTVGRHSGGRHLIISHNQTIKALVCKALHLPTQLSAWNQTNCSINVFALQHNKPPILRLCNASHSLSSDTPPTRARLRTDNVRIILHQIGDVSTLTREISTLRIARIFAVGKPERNAHVLKMPYHNITELPFLPTDIQARYDAALRVLDRIRTTYRNELVVIASPFAEDVCTFFAASLNMGPQGMSQLHSDPGGVTILDMYCASSRNKPTSPRTSRVECFNVRGVGDEQLMLQYTQPFNDADVPLE